MKIEFRFTSSIGFAVLEFTKVNPMVASWDGDFASSETDGNFSSAGGGRVEKGSFIAGFAKVHAASDFTITS